MRLLLAVALLLFSTAALADGVLRGPNGDMIVFKDSPCVHAKIVPLIKDEFLKHFKSAAIRISGKGFAACWGVHPDDPTTVYIIDEDGDQGAVPYNAITFDPKV